MEKVLNDLKKRLKENWKILLCGIIIFILLVWVNNIFDYSSYSSEIKYNRTMQGGRTPQLEKGVEVTQTFIAEKNNLNKIGILSLMPGISTNSIVNVKVTNLEKQELILDQDVLLTALTDGDYFEVIIPTQFSSRNKTYEIKITGVDGDNLNSIQFPYSPDKSKYLLECNADNKVQDNNVIVRLSFDNRMGLKKIVPVWGILFICVLLISIYGINKKSLKKDLIYFSYSLFLGILSLVLISTIAKIHDETLVNIFKDNLGIISLMLTTILGTIYYFIVKNLFEIKIKLETVYLMLAIPIGIIYLFATPFGKIPDEITHATRALDISYGHFIAKSNENNEAELFYNESLDNIFSINNKTYLDYRDSINKKVSEDNISYKFSNMALYFPICHLSQAFGMLLTRIFGASLIIQLYAGRLLNMLVTEVLLYFAIKYIPFKKMLIFIIGMLPIAFQEMASLSSDSLTLGITIFYIAYILYLRYDNSKENLNKKDWLILAISSLVVAMSKIVYMPLCILLFLIPESKTKSKKNKLIKVISIFSISVILNLLWTMYSSKFLIEYNIGVDSKKQVMFILTNPFEYISIMIRTLCVYFQKWWLGLCGHDLGIYGISTIDISYVFVFLLSLLLGIFLITDEEEYKIENYVKFVFVIVFLIITALIFTSLYVQFNRVQNIKIEGIQPRYFISVLPLIAMIFSNNIIKFKKLDKKYILIFLLILNIHTISFIINSFLV